MKKIMIAAVAMAMAVVANAASVNWKVGGSSAQIGYTAYLMAGDVVSSWESAADVQAAAIASGAIAKSGREYMAKGTATDAALTKSSNFYYIIVNADASQYAVSGAFAGSAYAYDTTATPPETAPSAVPQFDASSATFSDWAKADGPSGDVPEPTSGLLLLVGAAGLALRRRRA
jgi:uncharacterized membrane protein YjjB (DUF3815 family)